MGDFDLGIAHRREHGDILRLNLVSGLKHHIVGLHIIESGTVSCTSCHDPHAKRGTMLCANCHEQDAATFAAQSAKAQEFHATMQANNLSCVKCHRGVAHGVPKWVEEMSKQQQQQQ